MTPTERAHSAQIELYELLNKKDVRRAHLHEHLLAVLSTADYIRVPSVAVSRGHQGFADKRPLLFEKVEGTLWSNYINGCTADEIMRMIRGLLRNAGVDILEQLEMARLAGASDLRAH